MEKASSSLIFSLAEPVGLFFIQTILSCFLRLHKFSLRFLALFHSQEKQPCFLLDELDHNKKSQFMKMEDLKMVMERMGLCFFYKEGEKLGDFMEFDEMSNMFEDKEPSLEEMKMAFCVFDEENDGFIDAVKLQRILCKLGFREGLELDECKRMVSVCDENKDGFIDFSEFIKIMESSFG
ncbi:hypothetical protein J5N97_005787 [Dioscorea zingiberensis]|uniref:EF-hand domain-containing protein n=1 Tax=Dioscorea zingiberensis TaxID=325984 RepID=A0A9D5D944_9LILI|nr:hypothetical protein J5N97_005787 [Dioscorea zingiberensis]